MARFNTSAFKSKMRQIQSQAKSKIRQAQRQFEAQMRKITREANNVTIHIVCPCGFDGEHRYHIHTTLNCPQCGKHLI